MTTGVLQPKQFSNISQRRKDPTAEDSNNKPRFTGGSGSKTMRVHKGHLPKPPATHPHHHKAGRRTRRAR